MYLKRLEMSGFKSFAERTRLEFEPGITAVVGPNGCGKSNVVDAIRWCLGEMSAKSLRSKILLDVIFNGSANRAASNLSEVSLTFDNTQNKLPVDYSEVTVTRRLYRSGESEYYLNKVQCRLRDIHELFLDTGVGEEGYSIMEQGRVEYILSARPEERRELFEEAAGVSRYKARRDEALRKMERTEIDLSRLADVIALIKEQMDKIEAAVRKARQYQKYLEDLKTMEITQALWEISQLDTELAQARTEITTSEDALQKLITERDQHDAHLAELRVTEIEQGDKLVELNKRQSEIDGRIQLAEQSMNHARALEEQILERDQQLEIEIAQAEKRLSEAAEKRAQIEGALQNERQAAQDAAALLQAEEETHRSHADHQKTLEHQEKSLRDSLLQNNQDKARFHNEVSLQRSILSRLEHQQMELQKDLVSSQEKLAAGEGDLARSQGTMQGREGELARLTAESDHAQSAFQKLKDEIERTDALFSELQEKYFEAKAWMDTQGKDNSPYAQGVQALASAGIPGISGPIGRLFSASATDEPIVKTALGSHVNDFVADTLEDAQNALRFLEENRKGRARILVLDRLSRMEFSGLAATVGRRSVREMVRTDAKFEPVARFLLSRWIAGGNTLYGDGVVDGGAEESPSEVPADAADLAQRTANLASSVQSVKYQRALLETNFAQLEEERTKAGVALGTARLQTDVLRQEKDRFETDVSLLREEIRLIGADLQKTADEQVQAQEQIREGELQSERLAAEEEMLRTELAALHTSLEQQRAQTSAAHAQLAVVKDRATSQETRLLWQEQTLASLEAETTDLQSALEVKRQERATSGQRVEEQRQTQVQSRHTVETEQANRTVVEQELEILHSERQGLQNRVNEAQAVLTELREQADSTQNRLQEIRLQHKHAEFRRENVEAQLKEKYGLTALEAQERHGGIPSQAVPTPDLERLRRRVESLGAVNLAAPEEHAQLEERYNFLLSQQQDLLKAKEDLTQTIQKINATTRHSFRETFEKVRENFIAIYGQLFQGGMADLRFTDEADLLNTGIEIFAQPPGKKLQSIALLSGGEKALTAVALLFAFFMVRPAPFAVLDEVDAPLDEANVTRFVTLIKAFTHQSQFLIITHNKRTMEMADTLYGVTMETLGVSKILSARLKKEDPAHATKPPEAMIAAGETEEAPA